MQILPYTTSDTPQYQFDLQMEQTILGEFGVTVRLG